MIVFPSNFHEFYNELNFILHMICLYCNRVLESHWFTWVTQMNHIPMEIDFDKKREWPELQVSISTNFFYLWVHKCFNLLIYIIVVILVITIVFMIEICGQFMKAILVLIIWYRKPIKLGIQDKQLLLVTKLSWLWVSTVFIKSFWWWRYFIQYYFTS